MLSTRLGCNHQRLPVHWICRSDHLMMMVMMIIMMLMIMMMTVMIIFV